MQVKKQVKKCDFERRAIKPVEGHVKLLQFKVPKIVKDKKESELCLTSV